MKNKLCLVATTALLAITLFAAPGVAQVTNDRAEAPASAGPGYGPRGYGWGPGMMMGPGMMGWGGAMCDPRGAGLAEWRMERIERLINPNEAQRAALNDLRVASSKAAELVSAACPRELPSSAPARLEVMEKRLDAMQQAVKIVRPAFEAFYATLNDEQKARVNSAGPRHWGWRGWSRGG
ncbi:MAG TPA: Spy/CpxP family protein refolding chaperone [Pseudolabrys sp.]|nr:Spy/CpxP family protein refolding chaperone [Pseudolabrys sp.]